MSDCPRCATKWKCPCNACTSYRSTKDPNANTIQTWRYTDTESQCLTCGFKAHLDYWLSWECTDDPSDPLMLKEIEEAKERSPDWRYWFWREHITEYVHGDYPIGTKCAAVRDARRGLVLLRFDEGILEVHGGITLKGETHRAYVEDIFAIEDERVFRDILKNTPPTHSCLERFSSK